MFHNKHFTLSEAKNLLPDIVVILSKITKLKKKLDDNGYNIYRHQYFGGIGPNGTGKYPSDLEELIRSLQILSESGIIIKNMDTGLIDFPHIRENKEEVYLCYLLGEEEIKYWHRINDGFAGRRSLEDL
ncbi:MAG TPA: DUF2203 domain-containing protein [Ignavibacteria bacterium]|nr:DUF2203 domain-containing protein [Ignavibacteria bacterium]